jgi:hypothetical protein
MLPNELTAATGGGGVHERADQVWTGPGLQGICCLVRAWSGAWHVSTVLNADTRRCLCGTHVDVASSNEPAQNKNVVPQEWEI